MFDVQTRPQQGECEECQAELWMDEAEPDEWGHVLCPTCREEAEKAETALTVMEFVDLQLKKILADEPRNQIWNAAARRFHFPEEAS